MQWKEGKIVKTVIRSTLGGNLRLRVPNALTQVNGTGLKGAEGENINPFFIADIIPSPVISKAATITLPELKKTFVYDLPTEPGAVYQFVSK